MILRGRLLASREVAIYRGYSLKLPEMLKYTYYTPACINGLADMIYFQGRDAQIIIGYSVTSEQRTRLGPIVFWPFCPLLRGCPLSL